MIDLDYRKLLAHYQKKSMRFSEFVEYFVENTGYEPGDSVDPDGQISRYIVWPGQATSYKIGMIKMLELRQRAMDELATALI